LYERLDARLDESFLCALLFFTPQRQPMGQARFSSFFRHQRRSAVEHPGPTVLKSAHGCRSPGHRPIISRAVASDQVVDIFAAASVKKPDISTRVNQSRLFALLTLVLLALSWPAARPS
jgi:hypothetical protein